MCSSDLPNVFRGMLTRPADGIAPEIKTAIFPSASSQPAPHPAATIEEPA